MNIYISEGMFGNSSLSLVGLLVIVVFEGKLGYFINVLLFYKFFIVMKRLFEIVGSFILIILIIFYFLE